MLSKFFLPRIWGRIYRERLAEPFIYNLASVFVAIFGNVVTKIDYDLVPRQPYAFGMLKAFAMAKRAKVERLVFIEFGVASGAGLLNLCRVGERLSRHFSIPFRVIGLDAGIGMPMPQDYRDHPELYLDGDFVPTNREALVASLPANAHIIYGPIAETIRSVASMLEPEDTIGFASIDVDYWSSTKDCYRLFSDERLTFLPLTALYLDDVGYIEHHPFAGELLATSEFNAEHDRLKITPMNQIRNWRIFKNAPWLDRMYWLVSLDSEYFTRAFHAERERVQLHNPYLVD